MSDPMPQEMTAEEFARAVAGADDDQIRAQIRETGTEQVLERIFEGMRESFVPERAQGVDAVIQWVVTDEQEHPYKVTIKDGTCAVERGTADGPKVALTADLVPFVRLITGQAQGPTLFMQGKLRISGDLMFSQRISTFFRQPGA